MKNIIQKSIRVIIISTVCIIAITAFIVFRNFYPDRIYSLPGKNRIFAQAIDSADETVHLKAADWPYTFWAPFLLGDAFWPEKYVKAELYQSKDQTFVALRILAHNENEARYYSAYDFSNHKAFHGGVPDAHDAILQVMLQRGNCEDKPIEVPSLNSGLYE